jgi:hypothetical protein
LNSGRKAEQKDFNRDSQIWALSSEDLQSPLRYTFSVSVVLFSAFQAMQTAQGIIDRLFLTV